MVPSSSNSNKNSTNKFGRSASTCNTNTSSFFDDEKLVLTGVPIVTHDLVMDVSHLGYSGLHLLKKNDPFMYYSIPGASHGLSEEDLDMMLPSLVLGSRKTSTEDDTSSLRNHNRRRSISDSHLLVRRRSRISYEDYPDVAVEKLMEEIAELRSNVAKRRRSSHEMMERRSSQGEDTQQCGSILHQTLLEMFNDTASPEEDEEDSENEN